MDKLHLIHIFCTVVKTGSFANAANTLSMSPSSISKAINRLETDVTCTLFHRSTRKLSLSAEGETYFITANQILSDLTQCEQQLKTSANTPEGHLKLNLPVSYGRIYILPLIPKFQLLYPEISLDLSFDDSYVDLVNGGYDLSIRTGTLEDKNHFTRKISPLDFLICASPDYIEKAKKQQLALSHSVTALERHPWIRFRFKQTGRVMPITLQHQSEITTFQPEHGMVVDDGEALSQLCSDGIGLTQVPHFIAKPWIQRGDVVAIFPAYRPEGFGVFITYPEKKLLPTKSRVFIDFLIRETEEMGESSNHTWTEDLPVFLG